MYTNRISVELQSWWRHLNTEQLQLIYCFRYIIFLSIPFCIYNLYIDNIDWFDVGWITSERPGLLLGSVLMKLVRPVEVSLVALSPAESEPTEAPS